MHKKKWIVALLVVVFATVYLVWQNNDLTVSSHEIEVDAEALDGLHVVQLSDLHAKTFGDDQTRLVNKVIALEPDIIVLTGDMVDSDVDSPETHLAFLGELSEVAPIYAVSGNHEYWSESAEEVETLYESLGVTSLEDACIPFSDTAYPVTLCGIRDYMTFSGFTDYEDSLPDPSQNRFNILLAHRPVYFESYAERDYDLVLSGHAHGGMIRLPFLGGLYGPDQGWFPSYTTGPYKESGTTMIVSRGLGNSVFPFRIQTRPEIIAIELKSR